ncbi:MAG: hypothetical protein PVH73_00475 [Candidatus Bathyarchaeota archaeon]
MRRKIECSQANCVNNVNGYCQSRTRNWLGICRFKRKPKPAEPAS